MQFLRIFLLFIFTSVLFDFCFGRLGNHLQSNSGKVSVAWTIYVDQSGQGNFTTIQAAINAVPSNNTKWIMIKVMRGLYKEKIQIPKDKPFIALYGSGSQTTTIAWGDAENTGESYTFSVSADNFVARYIAFKNIYNHNDIIPNRKPAVAAAIRGDKNAFHHCSFLSLQDTLWDTQGRHYFQNCYVEGAVDFIFGAGQSIYEKVDIMATGRSVGYAGYITAQGRENPTDSNGFVFKYCTVQGNGKVYLGRAWRAYSRVVFFNSTMTDVVMPAGWDAWDYKGQENTITYAETGNTGPGADTSKRVPWEKQVSGNLNKLLYRSYIDREGWIDQQP